MPYSSHQPRLCAPAGYYALVERLVRTESACAVAAAAAHDLNDELTVILSSVTSSILTLEPGHPARPLLFDLRSAAQRCAWKTYGLLNYGARHGVRPVAAPLETLLEN
jgi:hypothetical protein